MKTVHVKSEFGGEKMQLSPLLREKKKASLYGQPNIPAFFLLFMHILMLFL